MQWFGGDLLYTYDICEYNFKYILTALFMDIMFLLFCYVVVVLEQSASNKTAKGRCNLNTVKKTTNCTKELIKAFWAAMLNEKIYCI